MKKLNKNAFNSNFKLKKIAIVLGFYEGYEFIKSQLQSIFDQTHQNFIIFVTDDNSKDNFSIEKLNINERNQKKIRVGFRNKNIGYAKNFLSALVSINGYFDYYAFSDQDDIWHPEKLEKAIKSLEKYPDNKANLYGSRTELIGKSEEIKLGKSIEFKKSPSFQNALTQNIFGGNTMVFNRNAFELICSSNLDQKIIAHDWWCYQIISGAGGNVFYDKNIFLKYRQHNNNLIGSNILLKDKWLRFCKVANGNFKIQNDNNLRAIINNQNLLTYSNRKTLTNFIKARKSCLLKRIFYFVQSGVYRQTLIGNIALFIGIMIKKV
tara:strand:+ start:1061 stop:2026 length:966 start_codon:yes stop_codon:yes gene_type:complete